MEPDETTDQASSLANMDIHDSVSQLMWGDLNPQVYYKPTPSLVDINGTTASFVLEYRISAVGDEASVTEIYNVKGILQAAVYGYQSLSAGFYQKHR